MSNFAINDDDVCDDNLWLGRKQIFTIQQPWEGVGRCISASYHHIKFQYDRQSLA